jgi:hypothetical protein
MPESLQKVLEALTQTPAAGAPAMGVLPFALLLLVSLSSSLLIAYLYTVFYASRATGSQVHRSFPLLGLSITAIFVCIQFSLPLSLGLLGALSIVRFRTPIKEPEEIGFIMLVIAVSIAAATFQLVFAGVLFVAAAIALVAQGAVRLLHGATSDGAIVVSLPRTDNAATPAAITDLVRRHVPKARLESVAYSDHETVLSYGVSRIAEPALLALPDAVRAQAAGATCNVFFARPNVV